MTDAEFWSFIRSALRQKSRYWKPIQEVKKQNRRNYVGIDKRRKFEYQCNECKQWYCEKEIEVDHVIECGSLKNYEDVGGFIKRLFCETEGLRVICKNCHNIKHNKNVNRRKNVKKN
jgi:hypothetical protein